MTENFKEGGAWASCPLRYYGPDKKHVKHGSRCLLHFYNDSRSMIRGGSQSKHEHNENICGSETLLCT